MEPQLLMRWEDSWSDPKAQIVCGVGSDSIKRISPSGVLGNMHTKNSWLLEPVTTKNLELIGISLVHLQMLFNQFSIYSALVLTPRGLRGWHLSKNLYIVQRPNLELASKTMIWRMIFRLYLYGWNKRYCHWSSPYHFRNIFFQKVIKKFNELDSNHLNFGLVG